MEYNDERQNLGEITIYLDSMEIPYKFQDFSENGDERFPALLCTYRCQNMDFEVMIYNVGRWIHVKAMVMSAHTLKSKTKLDIYQLCLELNYDLPECTFSSHKDIIYIEIDCLKDVDSDDFIGEFQSIGDGIDAFVTRVNDVHKISIQKPKNHVHDGHQRKNHITQLFKQNRQ
ncbi:MAG: hypothetical protein ACTSVU_02125 [Promethearchaeota archaeon]